MFSVCLCARFQANPKDVHLSVVKKYLQIPQGTSNLSLCYKAREKSNLQRLCDSNYVGDKVEWKSINVRGHFIEGNLVS